MPIWCCMQNIEQSIPPAAPGKVVIPRTVGEVVEAVRAAKTAGVKLRCIGHGDTWTPVFFDPVRYLIFRQCRACITHVAECEK